MIEDIRTEREKALAERRDKVVELYQETRQKFPDASENRIFQAIADEMGLSCVGVRTICIERGVTQPVGAASSSAAV